MIAKLIAALLMIATLHATAQVPPQSAAGQQTLPVQTNLNLPVISRRVAGPFYLNVPFNIQTPRPEVKIIQVSCTAYNKSPGVTGADLIGYGSGTVQIDGKAVKGSVDVYFKPFQDNQTGVSRSLEDATHYKCNLVVSNGTKIQAAVISEMYQPHVESWAIARPGSVIQLEGPLEF